MTPKSILFACTMNSVRSPMAEALAAAMMPRGVLVASCGVHPGLPDPFVPLVLGEIGIAPAPAGPKGFGAVEVGSFDTVIALTPEAAGEARRLGAKKVLYWDTPNPSDTRGDEAALQAAYRLTRDLLRGHIEAELLPGWPL